MGLVELQRAVGVVALQESIRRRLRYGGSLEDVEDEIIEDAPLEDDQKAALRLFAVSELPQRRRQAELRLIRAFPDLEPDR